MILTCEMDKYGLVKVFFDGEGREQLIELLAHLSKPGNHEHLTRVPNVSRAARNVLSDQQFETGSKVIEELTFVYLRPDAQPAG